MDDVEGNSTRSDENEEITVFYESEIKEIKENTIIINTPEETKEIKNDFVLAMTGYQPNYEILEKLKVSNKTEFYFSNDKKIIDEKFDIKVYNKCLEIYKTLEKNYK